MSIRLSPRADGAGETARIYLDHNATTPVDERVLAAMWPHFRLAFGNAASVEHDPGREALAAVTAARETVAACINASPDEIVFTSGATESNNLAIKGAADLARACRFVTSASEHKAVLEPCRQLERRGHRVTVLPVDPSGAVDPEAVRSALGDRPALVSVMHANNEIGTVNDIAAIGELCRSSGALFHTDAAQSVGKLPFDVRKLSLDMASISAHKLYGPKGVGALYLRRHTRLSPQIAGGGHEGGLRSGTLNVPGIVGLAKALELATKEMDRDTAHAARLRDRLWSCLRETVPEVRLNGPDPGLGPARRLAHNLHVSVPDRESARLAWVLRGVAVSSRSACIAALDGPSHVLAAIGAAEAGFTSIRMGVGRGTRDEDIDYITGRLRASPGERAAEAT